MSWLTLALWVLISAPFHLAHAQFLPLGVATPASAPAAYTGDLDIAPTGIHGWWGFEAASSATRGATAINVCLPADSLCADISTNATTGQITSAEVTAAGLSACANSVTICTVKTFYEKSASGLSSDLTNPNIVNRPTFKIPGGGNGCPTTSLYCACFDAGAPNALVATATTLSDPFTIMAMFNNTASLTYAATLAADDFHALYMNAGTLDFFVSADQNLGGTAINTWYVGTGASGASGFIHAMPPGAAAELTTSATDDTPPVGTHDLLSSDLPAGADFFTGCMFKAANWSAAVSAANVTSIGTHTRTRLGY